MFDRRTLIVGASAIAATPRLLAAQDSSEGAAEQTILELRPRQGRLRAQIAPGHGGILAGLQYKLRHDFVELLYRGRDFSPVKGWSGKAPILWPATGPSSNTILTSNGARVEQGWSWNGQNYPMPMHGFAMQQRWKIEESASAEKTAFALISSSDSVETRTMYPFGYRMAVEYRLAESTASISYHVEAARNNEDPMPFSAGNHITFRLPFIPSSKAESLTITSSAKRQIVLTADHLPSGEVADLDFSKPRLLSSLGVQTPLSLGGCPPGNVWARLEDPAGMAVTVSHQSDWRPDGEPVLFNLWGNVPQGFFAPEPWMGKQNSLVSGDGLIHLPPGEVFNWRIEIDVGRFGPNV